MESKKRDRRPEFAARRWLTKASKAYPEIIWEARGLGKYGTITLKAGGTDGKRS